METVRFDELDLYPQVLRAIADMGFEEATPIQSQAIPVVMSGVDVIGQAQTGTGKTASFGIPVLHKVDPNSRKTQVIILSPTRELAIQVADEIRKRLPVGRAVGLAAVAGVEHGFQQAEQERAFKRVAERNVAVLAGQVVQHGQQSPAVREGHRDVELRGGDGGGCWGEPTGGRASLSLPAGPLPSPPQGFRRYRILVVGIPAGRRFGKGGSRAVFR